METSCKRNQVENLFPQLIEIKHMHDIYWGKIGLKNRIIKMAPLTIVPKMNRTLVLILWSSHFDSIQFTFISLFKFLSSLRVVICHSNIVVFILAGGKKKKLNHSQLLLKLLFDRLSPFGRLRLTFFLTTFNFTLLPLFGFGVFSI